MTTEGGAVLPALAEGEEAMLVHGITLADFWVLNAIGKNAALGAGEIASDTGMDRQEFSRHIGHLIRHRYLNAYGLFRRRVKLSPRGKSLIAARPQSTHRDRSGKLPLPV